MKKKTTNTHTALYVILVAILVLAAVFAGVKILENKKISLIDAAKEGMRKTMTAPKIDYSDSKYWYQTGNKYDSNKIDVFYVLATELTKAVDENGNQVFNSTLSDEDKSTMEREYKYISTKMFDGENFNFISPYYRQLTFEAYAQTDKSVTVPAFTTAIADVIDAFDYYMEHQNNGRPFILAGFSQGGLMTQILLMHMTDEQYSHMIAAYSMGFQVQEKELQNSHFKPATSADDLGVIISYNSVASTDTMWEQIEGKSAACINPLNWKTDDTPAELNYNGDKATVHVDQKHKVLVVEGLDVNKYYIEGFPIEKGIYHIWDVQFYNNEIKQNAIHRAELFNKR